MTSAKSIAIIGAGMAGLSCATRLSAAGHAVDLFDKGRGPGGRMATRRAEVDGETLHFDHGAQYLTAKDKRFAKQVAEWEAAGVVARWPAAGEGAFVGVPGMNAPIKAMAAELNVRFGKRVEAFGQSGGGWRLDGEDMPRELFDTILVAVPAEQAGPLLTAHAPAMADIANQAIADPCWTVMVSFAGKVDHPDIIRDAGAIGWAARNSAKPGREGSECWVVQASPDWSRAYLEDTPEAVITLLLASMELTMGESTMRGKLPEVRHATAHRWRYARSGAAGEGALWDAETHIGACGDWLIGPRIEDAFLSGFELAEKVLADG